MEAVPRMPMLAFELKTCSENIEFTPVLKRFIQDQYNEDPTSYNKECTELDQLRQTATRVSRDFMGCSTLKKYYAQLQFVGSRFPMSEDGAAAVAFTWDDVYPGRAVVLGDFWDDIYTGRAITHADIKYEQACVLYNIGALHSILGAMDNRQSSEGMKVSCTHFQCAAWAFQHLRDHYPTNMSTDMSHDVLSFQIQLMLAQAQECILEKSMTDNRKSTITAKVAAQIVEYYKQATKNLDTIISSVGSRRHKDWSKRIELKSTYHQCVMNLYMGNQSEEQQKWGERVAYYQAAMDQLNHCLKMAKHEEEDSIEEALRYTLDVVGGKYNAAKKDNDFIYHEKIPTLDSLPEVKGASLVKGIPFNVNDPEVSGTDIFQRLVPMAAHEAASLYSEEKAKLLRSVGTEIEDKNQELQQFMSSLQLDPSKLVPEPERLPHSLLEKCAAISVKTDAIQELVTAMTTLSGLALDTEASITDIEDLIAQDQEGEQQLKEIVGNRAPNIIISELKKECAKYKDGHTQTSQSNVDLHHAMNTHITNLRLLARPLDQLQVALPSVELAKSPEEEVVIKELQRLMGKVDEMKTQRNVLEDQFRKQVHDDDITNALVTRDGGSSEDFFREQLMKHDKQTDLIRKNLAAQDNILRALTEIYANYATTRKSTSETQLRRDAVIAGLIESYDVYEELLAKSMKGIDFYKKLEVNVSRLLTRTRGVCKVQQEEREQILNRLKPKGPPPSRPTAPKPMASSPSPVPTGPPLSEGPTLKDYLPFMKPATFGPKSGGAMPAGAGMDAAAAARLLAQSGGEPNGLPINSSDMNPSAMSGSPQMPARHDHTPRPGHAPATMPPGQDLSQQLGQFQPAVSPNMNQIPTNVPMSSHAGHSQPPINPVPTSVPMSSQAGNGLHPMPPASSQNASQHRHPVPHSQSHQNTGQANQNAPYHNAPHTFQPQAVPHSLPHLSVSHASPDANRASVSDGNASVPLQPWQQHSIQPDQKYQHYDSSHTVDSVHSPIASAGPAQSPMPPGGGGGHHNQLPDQQMLLPVAPHQAVFYPHSAHPAANMDMAPGSAASHASSHPQTQPAAQVKLPDISAARSQQSHMTPGNAARMNQPNPTSGTSANFQHGFNQFPPLSGMAPQQNMGNMPHPHAGMPHGQAVIEQQAQAGPQQLPHISVYQQLPGQNANVNAMGSHQQVPQHTGMQATQQKPGPQNQAHSGPHIQAQPGPPIQAQPGPQNQALSGPHIQGQPGPQMQAQPGPPIQAQSGPQMQSHPGPQIQAQSGPQIQAQPAPKIQAHPGPQIQAHPGPQIQAHPGPQIQSHSGPQIQAQPGRQIQAHPGPQIQSHSGPQIQAQSGPQIQAQQIPQNMYPAQPYMPGSLPAGTNIQPPGPAQNNMQGPVRSGQGQIQGSFPGPMQAHVQAPFQGSTQNSIQAPPMAMWQSNSNPAIAGQSQNSFMPHYPDPIQSNQQARFAAPLPHNQNSLPGQPQSNAQVQYRGPVQSNSQPIISGPGLAHIQAPVNQTVPGGMRPPASPQHQGPQNAPPNQQYYMPAHQSAAGQRFTPPTPHAANPRFTGAQPPAGQALPPTASGQRSQGERPGFTAPSSGQYGRGVAGTDPRFQQSQYPARNVIPQQGAPGSNLQQQHVIISQGQHVAGQGQMQASQGQGNFHNPLQYPTPEGQNVGRQGPHPTGQGQIHTSQGQIPPVQGHIRQQFSAHPPHQVQTQFQPSSPAPQPPGQNFHNHVGQPQSPVPQLPYPALPSQPGPHQTPASLPYSNQPYQPPVAALPTTPTLGNLPTPLAPTSVPAAQPSFERQISNASSLDDLLSSSLDAEDSKETVLTPKVITADDIKRQKEEELKASLNQRTVDPYADPERLTRLAAQVERAEHIMAAVDQEWKEILEDQEKTSRQFTTSIARCYPLKNRQPDIMPYDHSRVVLTSGRDDYINASHIDDMAAAGPKFIVTQAPLPSTMADFWLMVYEQNTEVIVMLSHASEQKKLHVYWPSEKGQQIQHGAIQLQLQNVKSNATWWSERIISLTNLETRQTRSVVHLQFELWPPSGFPEEPTSLLQFIAQVQNFYSQQRSLVRPLVVHCSNGIGRTGAFCVINTGVQEINQGNGLVDVAQLVRHVHTKRKFLLHEKEQLRFCHQMVLMYAQDTLMKKGIVTNKLSFGTKPAEQTDRGHHRSLSDDIVLGQSSLSSIQSSVQKLTIKDELHQPSDPSPQNASNMATTQDIKDAPGGALSTGCSNVEVSSLGDMSSTVGSGSNNSLNSQSSQPTNHSSPHHRASSQPPATSQSQSESSLPHSLAHLQNPQTFTLDSAGPKTKKINKASFKPGGGHIQDNVDNPGDPLSQLDPLWSIKDKK